MRRGHWKLFKFFICWMVATAAIMAYNGTHALRAGQVMVIQHSNGEINFNCCVCSWSLAAPQKAAGERLLLAESSHWRSPIIGVASVRITPIPDTQMLESRLS